MNDQVTLNWAIRQGLELVAAREAYAGLRKLRGKIKLGELLANPKLGSAAAKLFSRIPWLDVTDGYWERAGRLRAKVLATGSRARLADTLIAQSCIDHAVSLVHARLGLSALCRTRRAAAYLAVLPQPGPCATAVPCFQLPAARLAETTLSSSESTEHGSATNHA